MLSRRCSRGTLAVAVGAFGLVLATLAAVTSATAVAAQYDLDHFWCYEAKTREANEVAPVILRDQFGSHQARVHDVVQFCNPTRKRHDNNTFGVQRAEDHLTFYRITTAGDAARSVVVVNQFGRQRLSVGEARALAVPTQKDAHAAPSSLDHFLCYGVNGTSINEVVSLQDQFHIPGDFTLARVMRPLLLCNPAAKAHPVGTPASAIMHREHHLVCYAVRVVEDVTRTALIRNQFEPNGDALAATESTMLCAPSRKQVVNSALGPAERESPGERE